MRAHYKGISLKKVYIVIYCLLCTITASAVSYASPYKGTGYHTGSVYASTSTIGMAQAPVVTMCSTSSYKGNSSVGVIGGASTFHRGGIITAASSVTGGVTTYTAGGYGPHKSRKGDPGVPDDDHCDCHWYWDEVRQLWVCPVCGSTMTQEDAEMDGLFCDKAGDDGHCPCPLNEDKDVWAFIAALAGAYALYKVRAGKTPYGDVRDDREMVAG